MTFIEAIDSINAGYLILLTIRDAAPFIIGKNSKGDYLQVKTDNCRVCGKVEKVIDLHYLDSLDKRTKPSYEHITTDEYNTLINKYFK